MIYLISTLLVLLVHQCSTLEQGSECCLALRLRNGGNVRYVFTYFLMCTGVENDVKNISVTQIVRKWCFSFRDFLFNRLSNIYIKCVKCVSYFNRVSSVLSIFYDFVNIGSGLFGYVYQVSDTFPCLLIVIFVFFKKVL